MNDSLRRTLVLAAAGLLLWGAWTSWESWRIRQELNALKDVVRSTDLNKLLSDPPEEVKSSVDLAIRGIKISQGREGRKSFELKANWATLDQNSGAVTVREPDITYWMENSGKDAERLIFASSDIGRVEDGNQKVSMSGHVRAKHEENELRGDLAVFLNQHNTLTFPGGATLNGPELSGSATRLTWNLDTNVLMGDHGVNMRWYPEAIPSPDPSSTPTPQTSDSTSSVQEISQP
ncbi:MAG: LPS export ABC transporter periplasmic protein LptC [Mailhella sp.]|nr:LPS export ABC transporter periplasmic protein LptC [Mailhella sp.]